MKDESLIPVILSPGMNLTGKNPTLVNLTGQNLLFSHDNQKYLFPSNGFIAETYIISQDLVPGTEFVYRWNRDVANVPPESPNVLLVVNFDVCALIGPKRKDILTPCGFIGESEYPTPTGPIPVMMYKFLGILY